MLKECNDAKYLCGRMTSSFLTAFNEAINLFKRNKIENKNRFVFMCNLKN